MLGFSVCTHGRPGLHNSTTITSPHHDMSCHCGSTLHPTPLGSTTWPWPNPFTRLLIHLTRPVSRPSSTTVSFMHPPLRSTKVRPTHSPSLMLNRYPLTHARRRRAIQLRPTQVLNLPPLQPATPPSKLSKRTGSHLNVLGLLETAARIQHEVR